MRRRGYILVEVLVASTLLSLAGVGLYTGFSKAMTLTSRVRQTQALYDPLKMLYFKADKDLRNMVSLREYPIVGKQEEIVFPSARLEGELIRVRYFLKDGSLMRSEESIPKGFTAQEAKSKILFSDVKDMRIEYAYLDEEDNLVFKPIWMDEPYFGIPRAVKLTIKTKKNALVFTRLFSIMQGRFGHTAVAS